MAFPSPHMGSHAGGPGAGMGGIHMLSGPPGMMPPSPMSMQGHGGQMQLAHGRGMSAFGQPGHDGMMLGSPALSAGHPSPMSPFAMQQMQAQPGRQQGLLQLPPGPGAFGGGGGGFGQPDFGGAGGMPHPALMPPTPMSPQMGGGFGGPDPMQAQQAQALQQLHAMQQQHSPQQQQGHHPFAQGGSRLQYPGATNPLTGAMQGMPTPPHSGNSAAYVMGQQPLNMAGRLNGSGSGSASQQQTGNGDFEMEQEVTVKTKLKGRGTFSGATSGSMQDSLNASHTMGTGPGSSRSSAYPQSLPPPYDSRMSGQDEMFGMNQGMGHCPQGQYMSMGR